MLKDPKVGQEVCCINNSGISGLTTNRWYTITGVGAAPVTGSETITVVADDGGPTSYYTNRFNPVVKTGLDLEAIAYKLERIQTVIERISDGAFAIGLASLGDALVEQEKVLVELYCQIMNERNALKRNALTQK